MPIFFDFVLGKIQGWSIWIDKELSDVEFVGRLEHAGILKKVAISRNLESFKDAKGLRHLVRCWCPSLHTFFFYVSELTINLEDVMRIFLILTFLKRILWWKISCLAILVVILPFSVVS